MNSNSKCHCRCGDTEGCDKCMRDYDFYLEAALDMEDVAMQIKIEDEIKTNKI